jgi:hypothetical protein
LRKNKNLLIISKDIKRGKFAAVNPGTMTRNQKPVTVCVFETDSVIRLRFFSKKIKLLQR